MLSAIGSPLIVGSISENQKGGIMASLKVKVLRAFYYQGKVIEKDRIIDLPIAFARQVIGFNKAEAIEANPHQPESEISEPK